jgi:O-antigen/teichoic acid export membrane protein
VGRSGLLWLLGSSFDQVYPAFVRLIPGIYALGPLAIIAAYFAGRNRMALNLWGALIGFCLMLAGDWLFIPRFHIMGAAIVSSIAYIGYFVYGYIVFYRVVPGEPGTGVPVAAPPGLTPPGTAPWKTDV